MDVDYMSTVRYSNETPYKLSISRNNGNPIISIENNGRIFELLFAHKKVSVYEIENDKKFLIRDRLVNLQMHKGTNNFFAGNLFAKLATIPADEVEYFYGLFLRREFSRIACNVGLLITGTKWAFGNLEMKSEYYDKELHIVRKGDNENE